MGRPRNEEETKQLSVKMPASERQRLLEVAFHALGASGDPDEINLSQWVRATLANLMDDYESGIPNGRVVVHQAYVDAERRRYETKLAELRES